MLHFSGDKITISQQVIRLPDISIRQHLTDIGAADDLSFLITLFIHDKIAITILSGKPLQHRTVPGRFVSEMAVRSGDNDSGVHPPDKNIGDKLFRCHMADFLVKRVLHDIIHADLLQEHLALRVRHDHGLHFSLHERPRRRREREHGDLKSLFLPFQHLVHQLLVTSVKSVKLSDADNCLLFDLKLSGFCDVLHVNFLPERFSPDSTSVFPRHTEIRR